MSAREGTIEQVLAGEADWVVECGDCLEVLPRIPDKGVAHVITDPPYSERVHNAAATAHKLKDGDGGKYPKRNLLNYARDFGFEFLSADVRLTAAFQFARTSSRWVLTFCDVEMSGAWSADFGAAGLDPVRVGAWVKPNATPQFSGDRPAAGFEAVVVAHAKGRKRWNGGGHQAVWNHPVINNVSDEGRNHLTPKPISLMLELVSLFTDPGELIADPFCGSGTTGVACLRLGRRFVGIERDPKYAAVARERLRAESKGLSLRDARAGQLSLLGGV